jgi:tetratricopeptide (TPR) repeat protein
VGIIMDVKFEHKIKSAKDFESKGKILHAIQIYRSLIEEFPEISEPYIQLADIYQSMGQSRSAENIIRLIYEEQPENYETTLYFSQFLMHNENWGKAIDLLKELNSGEPFAEYLTGYCYYKIEKYELAKIHLMNFVKSDDEPELIHEAYFILAKIGFELQNYEDALKHAKKAELIFNDEWELYLIYAKIYYKFKMFNHSYDSIQKAIKINENKSVLHKWAGKINLRLDNFSSAKEHFKKYINLKDGITSEDYTYLAGACLLSDDINNALFYFELALKSDAENKRAILGREKVLKMIEDNAASDY